MLRVSAVVAACCCFCAFAAAQSVPSAVTEGSVEHVSLADSAATPVPIGTPPAALNFVPPVASSTDNAGSGAQPSTRWSHLAFEAGAGFTQPNGTASDLLNPGWSIRTGAGWNFSRHLGVLAEYDFSRYGWQSPVLSSGARANGNVHIWSLTAEPIWRYKITDHFGGYGVAGVGFYRQVTGYGNKVPGTDCNPFFGCYPVTQTNGGNSSSGNQVGANGGLGFTYKTKEANRWAYYLEVRFTWLDTRPETAAFFPVSLGVRW